MVSLEEKRPFIFASVTTVTNRSTRKIHYFKYIVLLFSMVDACTRIRRIHDPILLRIRVSVNTVFLFYAFENKVN